MQKIELFTEDLTKKLMDFQLGENQFGHVFPQGHVPNITKIKDCLSKAGGKPKDCDISDIKKGGNGIAKPEYIINFKDDPSTIIVIECKKNTSKHCSINLNKPADYAVDGALYYAKFLKNDYNVIAIGISGTDQEKTNLDVFYWNKSQESPLHQKKLTNIFLTPLNYLRAVNGEKISKKYSLDEIRETAIDFHEKLREIKVTERQKPIFIAGILIALENETFSKEYSSYITFKSVITNLTRAIDEVLDYSDIKREKISNIKNAFIQIGNNQKLKDIPLGEDNSIIWYIEQLEIKIKPMMNYADSSLDALGVFYHEFVKYSGGDGSGLGIVLTPQHLTEFMCEIADVNTKSRIVDICCGSGSFLVSAMNSMFRQTADNAVLNNIRKDQLYGIELDQDLYVLAIANMIIRKDGKSNIIHGDCFNSKVIEQLHIASKFNLNIGLLNPPYSQKEEELEFVEQLLAILKSGGKAAVVVPMSCAIGTKFKNTRRRLLQKHTLKAVFSMPDDIFYPTGTNVCVMLWEAHKPHDSEVKTFFGYNKNDGFVKRKKIGRIDPNNTWNSIKNNWISLYRNSESLPGLSAKETIAWNDEWLCEAYMSTDYSKITDEIFKRKIRSHLAYLVENQLTTLERKFKIENNNKLSLQTKNWVNFNLTDLFGYKRGSRLTKENRIEGTIPLVTAGESNSGVKDFISNDDQEIFSKSITIDMFCNSYVHIEEFCCDDNIIVLSSIADISKYSMLFISAIIEKDKYRYQYGRQYRQKNLKEHVINLPSKKNGKPDYEFMENFIKTLPYSEMI